jgi:hypothetical protein
MQTTAGNTATPERNREDQMRLAALALTGSVSLVRSSLSSDLGGVSLVRSSLSSDWGGSHWSGPL